MTYKIHGVYLGNERKYGCGSWDPQYGKTYETEKTFATVKEAVSYLKNIEGRAHWEFTVEDTRGAYNYFYKKSYR